MDRDSGSSGVGLGIPSGFGIDPNLFADPNRPPLEVRAIYTPTGWSARSRDQ